MQKTICTAAACLILLQLPGCATSPDGEKSRTGQGAAIGAIVGGLLGAATGGDRKAILTGAAVGAALGAAIGHYQDRQVASRAEAARRVALASEPRLEIDGHGNQPQRARPGVPVESQVGYTVLAPGHSQDLKVTESRVLVRGGESFPLGQREVTRPQGSHVSTLRFTLPADLPSGDYTLVTTIASGGLTRTVQSPLSVG